MSVCVTHIKHLLPHRGRVRRALIGQQPFRNCAGGRRLVVLIKRTETERGKNTSMNMSEFYNHENQSS